MQSPNFLGVIEQVAQPGGHGAPKGALVVTARDRRVSLGAVRPPASADIVAMEAAELRLGAKLRRTFTPA